MCLVRASHRQPVLTLIVVKYENHEVAGSKSDSKSDLEDITRADWTVAEETALRRKIDRRIVPLVTVLYLLCVCVPGSLELPWIHGSGEDVA